MTLLYDILEDRPYLSLYGARSPRRNPQSVLRFTPCGMRQAPQTCLALLTQCVYLRFRLSRHSSSGARASDGWGTRWMT